MTRRFETMFGSNPRVAKAPARVNIVGEHTDYNDGLVLPTTTALHTSVAWGARNDERLVVHSDAMNETRETALGDVTGSGDGGWFDYVVGVVAQLQDENIPLCGANLLVTTNIPIGGGLSSSASLELAVAHALLMATGQQLEPLRLAQICQRAESLTVGLNCGIMDQYAIERCPAGEAMLIDCRTLDIDIAPLPDDGALVLVDTGVKHRLPDGEYNDRRTDCENALAHVREAHPEIASLRDLTPSALAEFADSMDESLYRRCRHVVGENERVAAAVSALRNNDLLGLGRIINESHESLCMDFEVSCDESDALVEKLNSRAAVYGARQVGAGFGGCVLALVDASDAASVASGVAGEMGADTWWHVVTPAEPAAGANGRADS